MDAIVIIGIGMLCLPLFLYLVPNIEASRNEARLMSAHNDTQRLSRSAGSKASDSGEKLPDLDPWGQPYRVVVLDTRQVRVMSSGPNRSFSPTGLDTDDIYSDMSDPPHLAIVKRKQRQIVAAMSACIVLWVSLATAYLWNR